MKILVTGGMGFIGHNVVNQLESQGHECYIVDNLSDYGFIPSEEIGHLILERQQFIKSPLDVVDIKKTSALDAIFSSFKPDTVLHLASLPRQKIVNNTPKEGVKVMIQALVDLLFLAGKYRTQRFVYVSSSMVYGDMSYSWTPEYASCQPKGQYAIFKYTGELLVKDWAQARKKEYVILRPSAVYGERDVEDRVISKFVKQALLNDVLTVRGHKEIMDFTHVEDCAKGITAATISDKSANQTFNITKSSLKLHTILEAAEHVVSITGSGKIQITDRDTTFPSRANLDIKAARNAFDYDPSIDLESGLKRYIDWVKSSSYWQKIISNQ